MDAEDNVDRISETIDLDYYYFQNNDKEKSQMLNYQTNRNNERNESSESKISSKESEFCSFKQSLSRIGLVLDLYLRNREYWFIKRIIKKATLDDFIALSKKSRKAQKSNIISQYIIQLLDFYLNDLEQREGAQKEDDQKKSILTNIDRIEYYLRMIDLLNVEKEDYRLESEEQNTSYFCLCDDLSCKFLEKYK